MSAPVSAVHTPSFRPIRAAAGDAPTEATPRPAAVSLLTGADTLVIAGGYAGRLMLAGLVEAAWRDHQGVSAIQLDNDPSTPTLCGPDGQRVALDAMVPFYDIATDDGRSRARAITLLARRYEGTVDQPGLLAGVPVFSTAQDLGGGGWWQVAMLDLDLHIARLRQELLRALAPLATGVETAADATMWKRLGQAPAGRQQRRRILVLGGGCGAVGPATHYLIPYLARWAARRLRIPSPLVVGVVAGPHAWDGVRPWTGANWRSTVERLDRCNREGLRWEGIDGQVVEDANPPYHRIIVADRAPDHLPATRESVEAFCMETGRLLWTAMNADLFTRLDARESGQRTSPWMTLRGVLADARVEDAAALAGVQRASGAVRALLPAP